MTEFITKSEDAILLTGNDYYPLEVIKEFIPCLDEITYRLLYLRFNENHLTEEEKKSEELMIKRLLNNKQRQEKAILEEFEKNEANQPLPKVEPNDTLYDVSLN